jgi:hypothetical protein
MGIAIAQAPVFFSKKSGYICWPVVIRFLLPFEFRQLSTKAKDCSELVA